MAFYLSMDGVDDRLSTPSLTFNEVVIENKIIKTGHTYVLGGAIFEYTTYVPTMSGQYQAFIDDVERGNTSFPLQTKFKFKVIFSSSKTSVIHIFHNGGWYPAEGEIYDVKIFNSGVLVAHYDMSTGTVQDQSGNGKHATLVGGTWVDDGQGGGTEPQTHTLSLSDSIATNDTISKRLSVIIADSITTSEAESEKASKLVSDIIPIIDTVSKSLRRSLTDSIGTADAFTTFNGKSILLTDAINITDNINITKHLNRFFTETISSLDNLTKKTSRNIKLYDLVVTTEEINTFNPGAPNLIGIVLLEGKRELYVYLQGERNLITELEGKKELYTHLQGGLNLKKNQNFKMVAGDSKTIVITVEEDLNGISAKWGLISKTTNTPILIKSGQISGDKIEINLEPSDTENLLESSFKHECEITDQQGKISTITTGNVKVEKSNI